MGGSICCGDARGLMAQGLLYGLGARRVIVLEKMFIAL